MTPSERNRTVELEVIRLDDASWRVSDLAAHGHPCPILAVIDRVAGRYRVTPLDSPASTETHDSLAEAVAAVEARIRGLEV